MINPSALVLPAPAALALRWSPGSKRSALVGGGFGLLVFLPVGLLSSLYYGGTEGVRMARDVFGVANSVAFGIDALLITGVLLSVAAVASVFAVLGAVIGTSVGVLTDAAALRQGRERALA